VTLASKFCSSGTEKTLLRCIHNNFINILLGEQLYIDSHFSNDHIFIKNASNKMFDPSKCIRKCQRVRISYNRSYRNKYYMRFWRAKISDFSGTEKNASSVHFLRERTTEKYTSYASVFFRCAPGVHFFQVYTSYASVFFRCAPGVHFLRERTPEKYTSYASVFFRCARCAPSVHFLRERTPEKYTSYASVYTSYASVHLKNTLLTRAY